MDYAIIMCFDEDTEAYFNDIIRAISESGASAYMTDVKIPPHITVAYFRADKIEPIINELDEKISAFKEGEIKWVSLGAFVPNVLFAAPVMSEYLLNACAEMNRLIEPFSTPGDDGNYLPYNWVPHTSLAVRLDKEGLNKAFDMASQKFTPIKGKSRRLLLAECNPYREIKAWSLK